MIKVVRHNKAMNSVTEKRSLGRANSAHFMAAVYSLSYAGAF